MLQIRFAAAVSLGLVAIVVAAQSAPATQTRLSAVVRTATTIRGYGSRVATIRLGSSRPLVATASNSGTSNFIVHLVGPTTSYLFNEIGPYSGQLAETDVKAGRYRVAVQAEGSWMIAFTQPVPTRHAKVLPGTIKGHGDRVIAVRTLRHLQPIVTATHSGQSNFIVHLVGYGTTTGEEFLFNEIGPYHGQTLVDDLPRGPYLLGIQADGTWTLRFTP